MNTSVFAYILPPDRIAQRSVEPRDQAKMLIVDRSSHRLKDSHVFDLPSFLRPNDLLIFNDSKVFRARLFATRAGRTHEAFLLNPREGAPGEWSVLISGAKKLRAGDILEFADGSIAHIILKDSAEGTCTLNFHRSNEEVFALSEKHGEIPTPPYVDGSGIQNAEYQTVYAKHRGSVAAPTAGFHFTPELLARIDELNVQRAFVTLHVGVGTFRPMKTETLEEHVMHREWASLPEETAKAIAYTKSRGGRVIAIGTTTVRVLESFQGNAKEGWTDLFIKPGYKFTTVDALLTNFHLPKSTLLVLVSALAGEEEIKQAYTYAINHEYRFYSFGDAMLIL